MRWAIIGAYGNDTLEFHLQDSLLFLGHEVKIFDITLGRKHVSHYWLRRVSESYDQSKARNLARQILRFKPDIVIGTYRIIHPLTFEIIKKANPSIIAIHINPDHLANLEQQQIIASNYDFLFTKDPYMQKFLQDKAKLNAYYLPEAFNPRFHITPNIKRQDAEKNEDTDILIFGNLYPYRTRIIEQILKYNKKVRLYGVEGPYFPSNLKSFFTNRVILGKDKSERIWGSKITLNNFHYAEIEGVNCKYFEINGIGGLQICDFKPTLEEYSPVDPKRYSFSYMEEALDLIQYYLSNTDERHEIAEIQREHFLTNHTYENRIQSILDIIKDKR